MINEIEEIIVETQMITCTTMITTRELTRINWLVLFIQIKTEYIVNTAVR